MTYFMQAFSGSGRRKEKCSRYRHEKWAKAGLHRLGVVGSQGGFEVRRYVEAVHRRGRHVTGEVMRAFGYVQ